MTVAVVIPSYNSARFIRQTIASVLAQTRPADEIVVVDDASTDGSADLAAACDSRVRVVRLPRNVGNAAARNAGIRETASDVIGWLDADDLWEPDKLERQLPLFEDPEVGLVYGRFRRLLPDGALSRAVPDELPQGAVLGPLYFDSFVLQSTALTRRSATDQVGGYDESLQSGVDYELFLRLARSWRVAATATPVTQYRIHDGQITRRFGAQMASVLRTQVKYGSAVEQAAGISEADRVERLAALHLHHVGKLYRRRQFEQARLLVDAMLQELPAMRVKYRWRLHALRVAMRAPAGYALWDHLGRGRG